MQGAIRFTEMEQVVFGRPAAEAVAKEAARLNKSRVFIIAGRTMNDTTDEVDRMADALGSAYAGRHAGIPPHSPRDAVVEAANAAREAGADLLVTFGGGSVTDGTKVIQICLEYGVTDMSQLDDYCIQTSEDGRTVIPDLRLVGVRQISVPTTLSGGEFNPLGGCTDPVKKVKQGYRHPSLVPVSVILDAAPTRHTPEWVFLSTGIRAVDHCVEAICSPQANPYCDADALHAIRLLSSGLPRVKADPADMDARLDCLLGAWMAMTAVIAGVPMGASHAIGHILGGTCDVPHGYTSCIMMPAVLRWNAEMPEHAERQKIVAEAFGRPGMAAGDAVREFVAGLGLPGTLGKAGVGQDQFDLIARNSLHDRWLHTNPRKVNGVEDVLTLLRMAS
ncbi:MAG: iron-containing alcohol dehydrogenase [Minwuia sp.]|uniref:iron-containing alcohol dehydrogenase n=1 Tax=Minwuia sp. TaxID=2493630 RepID=UPI003A88CB86